MPPASPSSGDGTNGSFGSALPAAPEDPAEAARWLLASVAGCLIVAMLEELQAVSVRQDLAIMHHQDRREDGWTSLRRRLFLDRWVGSQPLGHDAGGSGAHREQSAGLERS